MPARGGQMNDNQTTIHPQSTAWRAWMAKNRRNIANDEHVKDETVEELAALGTDFRPAQARCSAGLEPRVRNE